MADTTAQAGDFTVTSLFDGTFEAPAKVLVHPQGEAARAAAIAALGTPSFRIPVHCFLVRGGGETMLIDTGAGTGWGGGYGLLRPALQALGLTPGSIDRVLLTHFHGDHALGLLEQGAAYFPNARVTAPEADLTFFTSPEHRAATPETRRGGFDVAARVLAAYPGRVEGAAPGPVLPGVELVALPGHTPGHSGYRLGTGAQALLVWGDLAHLPGLQLADPQVGLEYDSDAAQAVETRRQTLAALASSGERVTGGHVTGFQRVRRSGTGYALDPVG
ncbi:MBL fold metallo-hydrolase [Paroceanicella profunda]|uniref:MBL fold metallo-hydrolase n=1 Tax=Paroceanicella profunda TaxID=2579971 RepID=A0A5B8FY03_9RHOB|nr:MBL fold metallo-hydrolase [Paroceanicella profunda]QDL93365.1 MBL fold metallo-hydrolase [Paroceanicella profunda]